MLDPGECSSRLCGCQFIGRRPALLGGGGRLRRYGGTRGWSIFVGRRTSNIIFQDKGKRFGTPYVSAVDRYFLEARKTTGSGDGTRLWKLRGIIGWQGTPRSEDLGGKHDLESRGSACSCTPSHEWPETTHQLPRYLNMWYYAGFK